MANYNVQITTGQGSENMNIGAYDVSVTANGYEATSLSPTTYTATSPSGSGAFTVSADGVLTLIFNETGAAGGEAITSGSVVMTDETGDTEYGSPIEINEVGVATFGNVPFDLETPYVLYFKQLSSDDDHIPYEGVFAVGMGTATQTEYIKNLPKCAEQSFTLTDENYGFPISTATLNFTAE